MSFTIFLFEASRSGRLKFEGAVFFGPNPHTGKGVSIGWVRKRLEHQASVLAIECLPFSLMSNYSQQTLRRRPDNVASQDSREVVRRWLLQSAKRYRRSHDLLASTEIEIMAQPNHRSRLFEMRGRFRM